MLVEHDQRVHLQVVWQLGIFVSWEARTSTWKRLAFFYCALKSEMEYFEGRSNADWGEVLVDSGSAIVVLDPLTENGEGGEAIAQNSAIKFP
jgi:hypothetical protein